MSQFQQPLYIAPSLLSADFAQLGLEVLAVQEAGANLIHFDVMDNHYVPNLTIGPLVCDAITSYASVPIDVHLMVSPVDQLIVDFAKSGASIITIHPEATKHLDRSLSIAKDNGCKVGVVLNPATPIDHVKWVMNKIDVILIMSVNPGFGGQKFIPNCLGKISQVRKLIDEHCNNGGKPIRLEVDGGIKLENIRSIYEAGADTFVIGSGIFNCRDNDFTISYKKIMAQIKEELK
jgi:ribulose-phosphate 3-epimerase